MASPSRTEFLALAGGDRRPSGFLSLAPATSASYPMNTPALVKSSSSGTSVAEAAAPVGADLELKRRTSSMSSDSSASGTAAAKQRFLKLGPIHHGVQTGDWSEM